MGPKMTAEPKYADDSPYNEDYYERGAETGVSLYTAYQWMPEETIAMANAMISGLPIKMGQTVLDYGCAKGYLVKALRILGVDAYGYDISDYARANTDPAVRDYCGIFNMLRQTDWIIAKDVFEHIREPNMRALLSSFLRRADKIFAVVPLSADDTSGKYIVPDYDLDTTHVLAKTFGWWEALFVSTGWKVERGTREFPGCKDRWVEDYPTGNGFFVLSKTE